MERWCPRCEWRGDSEGQACPSCGTRLIELTRSEPDPEAPEPRGDPFQPIKAPAPARPLRKGAPEAASEAAPEADQEPTPDETPSDRQRSIWRRSLEVAWTILPLAVVGAIVASIVSTNEPTSGTKAPPSPTSSPDGETSLPPILVALRGGQGGQDGGLYASLNGHEQDVSGIAIVSFEVGPTGTVGAIDPEGDLHLLPGSVVVRGPVLGMAFSPDGRSIAICRGEDMPPELTIVSIEHPTRPIWPPVVGCEPMWSTDSNFIAFRIPSGSDVPRHYLAGAFGVLDVRVDVQFRLEGSWPVAWAPSYGFAITPLTVISAVRDSVDTMDPTGGRRRTLVTSAMVRRLTGGRYFGSIDLLAWSPDGERLALGSASGANGFGLAGIALVDPRTGQGTFAGSAYNPLSLSWSSAEALIAELAGRAGRVTRLMPKDAPYLDLLDLDRASWSPDGRWILGRSTEGWVTIDSLRADRWNAIPTPTSDWVLARWCCPPVPIVYLPGTGPAHFAGG